MIQENILIEKLLAKEMVNEAYEIVSQLSQNSMFPNPRNLRNPVTEPREKWPRLRRFALCYLLSVRTRLFPPAAYLMLTSIPDRRNCSSPNFRL